MKYLSVCSGIEAASVAWQPLGWQPIAFSEIEPFPCAVLAHHFPDVPNWGDMTKFQEWPDADVDVLCGGTPCQSFSVAGLRKGLDDPRGNLMLTFLAIARKYRPRWIVWENVPGVLTSNKGRDFGTFVGGLGECGYGWAYRVLDAQYVRTRRLPFAVPQRRRRVFVVGYLGDWRRAAAVLFEPEGLHGDPAPRREAGQNVAPTIRARAKGGGGLGTDTDCDGGLIASHDPAVTLTAREHKGALPEADLSTVVAHALRGEGFDASEDGTGRGTPIVPVAHAILGKNNCSHAADLETYIPFDTTQTTSPGNVSNPKPGDPCHPLAAGAHPPAIAFNSREDPDVTGNRSGALSAGSPQSQAIAIQERAGSENPDAGPDGRGVRDDGASYTLEARTVPQAVATPWAVRRLTPLECERLQGFTDGWTDVPYRRRNWTPDGPRYKSCGNSWATNCAELVGERMDFVDALFEETAA